MLFGVGLLLCFFAPLLLCSFAPLLLCFFVPLFLFAFAPFLFLPLGPTGNSGSMVDGQFETSFMFGFQGLVAHPCLVFCWSSFETRSVKPHFGNGPLVADPLKPPRGRGVVRRVLPTPARLLPVVLVFYKRELIIRLILALRQN